MRYSPRMNTGLIERGQRVTVLGSGDVGVVDDYCPRLRCYVVITEGGAELILKRQEFRTL